MQLDLDTLLEEVTQDSHHGHPVIIETSSTGGRGRPKYVIDRAWLAWAHMQRTTSGIAHFLGISRKTVRQALLDYGLAQAGNNPFSAGDSEEDEGSSVASGGPSVEGSSGFISMLADGKLTIRPQTTSLYLPVKFHPQTTSLNQTFLSHLNYHLTFLRYLVLPRSLKQILMICCSDCDFTTAGLASQCSMECCAALATVFLRTKSENPSSALIPYAVFSSESPSVGDSIVFLVLISCGTTMASMVSICTVVSR